MDGGLRPSQPDQIKEDIGVGGILIYGEKGIISCNDYGTRAKLYIDGEVVETGQFDGIPSNSFNHYTSWVEAMVDGYGSDKHKNLNSGFDVAGPISEVVLLGNVAVRSGLLKRSPRSNVFIGRKRLDYDSKNMVITNKIKNIKNKKILFCVKIIIIIKMVDKESFITFKFIVIKSDNCLFSRIFLCIIEGPILIIFKYDVSK